MLNGGKRERDGYREKSQFLYDKAGPFVTNSWPLCNRVRSRRDWDPDIELDPDMDPSMDSNLDGDEDT